MSNDNWERFKCEGCGKTGPIEITGEDGQPMTIEEYGALYRAAGTGDVILCDDCRTLGSTLAEVSQEVIDAGLLVGASGTEMIEHAIHTAFDQRGVPREGREVKVTRETIEIALPAGWKL